MNRWITSTNDIVIDYVCTFIYLQSMVSGEIGQRLLLVMFLVDMDIRPGIVNVTVRRTNTEVYRAKE